MHESYLENSSYKKIYDEAFGNVFSMPEPEFGINDNKFLLNVNDNIEEKINLSGENDPSSNWLLDQQPHLNESSETSKIIDESSTEINSETIIDEKTSKNTEITAPSEIEQNKNDQNDLKTNNDEQISYSEIQEIFSKDLPKLINQSSIETILNDKLPINEIDLDKVDDSIFCFDFNEFHTSFLVYQNSLNTPTKRIVFKFLSLTCSQVIDLIFENFSDLSEYSEDFKTSVKKFLTQLSYDILQNKLVEIFENTNLTNSKRLLLASSNFINIVIFFFKERKLIKSRTKINDEKIISVDRSAKELKNDDSEKRKVQSENLPNEEAKSEIKKKRVSKETIYSFPNL